MTLERLFPDEDYRFYLRALRTMPGAVARYKGLESARERLLELLADSAARI